MASVFIKTAIETAKPEAGLAILNQHLPTYSAEYAGVCPLTMPVLGLLSNLFLIDFSW